MELVFAAEGELNPLIPHPVEIVVGTIAFLLLFWLLAKTVFPQFEKVYAERTDKIEGGLKRAEEAQEQAAALKRQYEEQLAGLRAEAARIRDDARADGNRIRAELREQAEQEAERIRQRGDEQLAAQREQAVRQLRGEIGGALGGAGRAHHRHVAAGRRPPARHRRRASSPRSTGSPTAAGSAPASTGGAG